MLVIRKKAVIEAAALIGLMAAIALVTLALGFLDAWLIHKYFPEIEGLPYYPLYQMPVFSPAENGRSILVDLDALTLTLYKDGEVEKTWPCSGGKKSTPSPLGAWQTLGEGDWGEGFGGSWIAISCPWGKFSIHGTVEPWTIGKVNASHGCIRMLNKDVAELKGLVSYGTPIYIKYDSAPFRGMKSGMTGSDVLELQIMLHDLGYLDAEPNGKFGPATEAALKRCQSENGLYADGVAGWATMEFLKSKTE